MKLINIIDAINKQKSNIMRSQTAQEKGKDDPEKSSNKKKSGLNSIIQKTKNFFVEPKKAGLKESIEEILEQRSETEAAPLDAGEKAILKNVLEFKELHVEDIMIPRADIFAIPEDIQFEDLQKRLEEKTYTRIPVYKGDLDEIIGFIHIKDVARIYFKKHEFNIQEILRKCLFMPPSMKISNLLIRMRQSKVHIAIVVDEYGGTAGIVSLEDIVEEIVGNIEDEHDDDETHSIKKISDDIFEVSSRISIDEFHLKTGIDISIKDDAQAQFDTIGGLVSYLLGRIPVKGEIIAFNDQVELEVTDADARSVRRLVVKKKN